MPSAEQKSTDSGLKHLEGKPFDAVLEWLDRALRGHEALPMVVPGESPEESILRHERTLAPRTRDDLRKACQVLVRRFVHDPGGADDDFVAALLRLGKGFALPEVASDLHALASAEEPFSSLPGAQQRTLLSTLFDMRAPLPTAFWHRLVGRDPERFGVIAFSGLLRHDPLTALGILAFLPDDEGIADAVYVVLGQHAQTLNPTERAELVAAVKTETHNVKPSIRSALNEWIDEQPPVQGQSAPRKSYSLLSAALTQRAAQRDETYKPSPRSARLVPKKMQPAA